MSIVTRHLMRCDAAGITSPYWDGCSGVELVKDAETLRSLRNGEVLPGWTRVDGKDFCPRHSQSQK